MDHVEVLVERIRARGIGASEEINPFWRRLLDPLADVVGSRAELSAGLMHKALGYGARRLLNGIASNRDLPEWRTLMEAVQALDVRRPEKAVEHIAVLNFLKSKDVLEEYVELIDRYRLASNLGLARLFWYGVRLGRVLDETRGRFCGNFIEIGSGSGFFAILMSDQGWVNHYVMIDFPEMLLNALLHVRMLLPNATIRLGETPDFARDSQTIWLLETGDISKVPSRSIDVALNFNSFMEMDEEVRDSYIEQIYRVGGPAAIFYNVNRRQNSMTRKDGRTFDNNPLLYPYRSSDRVMEWETDECQENCRSAKFLSPHPSFCISRMAEI